MSIPIESTAPERGWRALHRLAPVRLLVFFAALVGADGGAQLGWMWASHHVPPQDAAWTALGTAIVLALALLGIYSILVRGVEGRRAGELSPAPVQATAGALLGFALFVAVIGLIHSAGAAQVRGLSARPDLTPVLAMSIISAIGEELAFRGGLFRIVEEGCGTTVALVLSAAIFGLLHGFNPGATMLSNAAIAIEAGVLLGAAYALTRNLWLPIGLHFGWNFTEGGIFGVSVSGGSIGKGVLAVTLAGPRFLTGGKFGPEASIIAVAVCFAAALALIALTVKSGLWKPLRWRMRLD